MIPMAIGVAGGISLDLVECDYGDISNTVTY